VRPAGEQGDHLVGRLKVPFGIGVEQVTGLADGGLVPDCRHYILQRATVGDMVMHVVGREQR
jgi:hypothetical protein